MKYVQLETSGTHYRCKNEKSEWSDAHSFIMKYCSEAYFT